MEQYLCWRVGLSSGRARQIAEIARRSEVFPQCMAAFGRGELTLDQVSAIVNKAPWWTDAEITDRAKDLTVRQLRYLLGKYAFPEIPEPGVDTDAAIETGAPSDPATSDGLPAGASADDPGFDAEAHDPVDRCSFHIDDAGRFHLYAEADMLTGKIIENALTEARDALFQSGEHDADWVDALRAIAERSIDSIPGVERRNRWRINFHLDAAGGCVDALGFSVPDAIRRYITCDGLLSPVITENGFPVSVGRSQHIVPDRTRRVVFTNGAGNPIAHSGAKPRPPGAPPPSPIGTYRHPDGGRMDPRWLYFTPPPDYRADVWATHPSNPANQPARLTALDRARLENRPEFD